jgi:hypothetical protein
MPFYLLSDTSVIEQTSMPRFVRNSCYKNKRLFD